MKAIVERAITAQRKDVETRFPETVEDAEDEGGESLEKKGKTISLHHASGFAQTLDSHPTTSSTLLGTSTLSLMSSSVRFFLVEQHFARRCPNRQQEAKGVPPSSFESSPIMSLLLFRSRGVDEELDEPILSILKHFTIRAMPFDVFGSFVLCSTCLSWIYLP